MDNRWLRTGAWVVVSATVLWFAWILWLIVVDPREPATSGPGSSAPTFESASATACAASSSPLIEPLPSALATAPSEPPEDDRTPMRGARKSVRVLPPTDQSGPSGVCDALRLPPREYVIDDAPTAPDAWEAPLPDMNGDGRPEVGTTSHAFLNSSGDSIVAVYLTLTPDCFRYVGVFFGDVVENPGERYPSWKPSAPRAFLVEARAPPWSLTFELDELGLVDGKLVVHRYRFRAEGVETAPHCTKWERWGKPFSREFWDIGLGEELPSFPEGC